MSQNMHPNTPPMMGYFGQDPSFSQMNNNLPNKSTIENFRPPNIPNMNPPQQNYGNRINPLQ